jgi:mannose-6-phosphate isomerase-like protein (cupin superfamily)
MADTGKNYESISFGPLDDVKRVTLHDDLGLTGSEISVNRLPPGASVPFLHSHEMNEEVYLIVAGRGSFLVDGEEFPVVEGTAVRVDPAGKRSIKAADDEGLTFICVQAACGTLAQYSGTDGEIPEEKPAWS